MNIWIIKVLVGVFVALSIGFFWNTYTSTQLELKALQASYTQLQGELATRKDIQEFKDSLAFSLQEMKATTDKNTVETIDRIRRVENAFTHEERVCNIIPADISRVLNDIETLLHSDKP